MDARTFPRLPPAAKIEVPRTCGKAEGARRAARGGKCVGYLDPSWDRCPRRSSTCIRVAGSSPASVPRRHFVAVRVYRETWNQEERRRDPSRVTRRLLYETKR